MIPKEHLYIQAVLDTPLSGPFDYRWDRSASPIPGQLLYLPFGPRLVCGLLVSANTKSNLAPDRIKNVDTVLELPPLSKQWIALCHFAARYYQRGLGEVALPALPKMVRNSTPKTLQRLLVECTQNSFLANETTTLPDLNTEQGAALTAIFMHPGFSPSLLFGVTGSGKTEVYLQAVHRVLTEDPKAQILILIPEINLTPQFEGRIRSRFPGQVLATLHSGLGEGERARHWLQAHLGIARIVLGTRLAVLASLPNLRLIVVDEEHDPSYKQQEGLRYSARDLAVWRAHQLNIPVVLGSATPSLETWQQARSGRYQRIDLKSRAIAAARLPKMQLINTACEKLTDGLSVSLLAAIGNRLGRGEQSLLYLNRRGFAPVLCCEACGWLSECLRCSSFLVWHKPDACLRCHHCSFHRRIPRFCPTCGNIDLQALGRGTQRIEEILHTHFPTARIARIDADSTRLRGSAQAAFRRVHEGEVDILVGTQMVAKGHDFQGLTLVGILNPDSALFSHDFRASERLFAQLMQVSGRAGRASDLSHVLIQTRYPEHPLYSALVEHAFEPFAENLLSERHLAAMPPFIHQALLRAEAPKLELALNFLKEARSMLSHPQVTLHDAIPMTLMRRARVERAQLLIESPLRSALQIFLRNWISTLSKVKTRVRYTLEVDPLEI